MPMKEHIIAEVRAEIHQEIIILVKNLEKSELSLEDLCFIHDQIAEASLRALEQPLPF